MLLEEKVAVVYGAGGVIGAAVAHAFAAEGARVFLAGRTAPRLRSVAEEIGRDGGTAQVAQVDALDEAAVESHLASIVSSAGRVDISFNAISHGDVHGAPLLEMSYDDFERPVLTAIRTQFVTTKAAAHHMKARGSGVIISITATTSRQSIPEVGGTGVAFDAMESLSRQWAAELGPYGIRVVWLLTTGIPEALHGGDSLQPGYGTAPAMTREQLIAWMSGKTLMNRLTTLEDVGRAAAWIASDAAQAMTAAAINLTYGAIPGR
jgi:NAD(P)-dependent dehydrogenase (short-subunit alcohol dehydrogenase family)